MLVAKGLSALHVRFGNVLVIALIVGLCIHISRYWQQRHHSSALIKLNENPAGGPSAEEQYLERLAYRYALTNQTEWLAWRIQSAGRKDGGSSLIDVGLNFGSQSHKIIDLRGPDPSALRAPRKMTLPARDDTRAEPTDASDFLFGISSSYERIADRDWALVRAWERWFTGAKKESNGAGLVLMLDKATDRQLQEVDEELYARGLDAYLMSTEEPMSMATRYHELVRIFKTYGATLAASGQRKKWFGLVEDTVFFPDLSYLGERLSRYNANDELYIGLPSERQDWHADGDNMTTYGGGAVLLTRQAVDRIPRLPCLEAAELEAPVKPKRWDALLKECVEQRGGLDMRFIPALYSPKDDGDGDLPSVASQEAGARPLVLHDYQDRHRLDVGMAHLVTDVCGEACFMQRYVFHDNWVLVNGVSISQHPDGLKHQRRRRANQRRGVLKGRVGRNTSGQFVDDDQEVERTFLTWTGRRNVWRLLDSAPALDGSVWQAYLRRGTRGSEGPGEMDSVIVLIWEQSPMR
ncbi:glycosyltransferase family 31 protein [Hirsutella rhossiliensis]|uniref:Glycosyltransferase family 31 protein n=1 Tax=Hirsutella rhossiliensis TaxID=111463 RepID=A0A9P8N2P8_9HYPO|nr:glycosyltransferase family 31 protein [Hirsutella rhossiliensis]KAH0965790.1 glycosyltransferase family 31 protein [Hirsutella rhossiliensis]